MPLGPPLRADGGGEFIENYYRDYCKTATIIQQFSSPNTSQRNNFSERDGRTITDVARCLLNGFSLGGNGGHRGVSTQSPAKQDHWRRDTVLQDVRQTCRPVHSADYRGPWLRPQRRAHAQVGPHEAHRSPHHGQPQQQLRGHQLLRRFMLHLQPGEGEVCIGEFIASKTSF